MDDIQNKISALLNDPAGLERVMSMAKSMGLSPGGAKPDAGQASPLPAIMQSVSPPQTEGVPQAAAVSALPALLGEGGDLMKAITSMDPKVLSGITRLFHEYNRPDNQSVLLLRALQPYLRQERRGKMDQAVNILKLAQTARVAIDTFGWGR